MEMLKKEDIIDIIWGSAFFAGGGGGSIDNAMMILNEIPDQYMSLQLCTIGEMAQQVNSAAATVAAIGSQSATEDETFSDEALRSIRSAIKDVATDGRGLRYLYSAEQGAANTMLAMGTAMRVNRPFLDTDGNGRAVPELSTTLPALYGVATSPMYLNSCQADSITLRCANASDASICEDIARGLCNVASPGLGFSAWIMGYENIIKATVIGQISRARAVGHAIRNSQDGTAIDNIIACFDPSDIHKYAEGYIGSISEKTMDGFDYGTIYLITKSGSVVYIKFQNENLLIMDQLNNVLLTVPDIITLVDTKTGRPITTAEAKSGQSITVIGVKADARWDTEAGYTCWKDILHKAEYDGPRHPLQNTV